MAATPLTLHVWPGRWCLPSIETGCLEAILYLQLAFPGCYSIIETTDPDLSPNGQLPFLTHGPLVVSPLSSILSYLSSINPSLLRPQDSQDEDEIDLSTVRPDLDAGLSPLHLSQRTAWRAYIETQLEDLVVHSFFVLEPNFTAFTHGMLASMLPIPQRYYVPRRLRDSYRPRLEAVGLWQVANEPEERNTGERPKVHTGDHKETTIRRAFGQAKLTEKARHVFDILSKLLDDKSYIFANQPTSIDLALASRILLLTHAPLPNPALKDLLTASYSSLVAHADRVLALALPPSPPPSNPRPRTLVPPRVNSLHVVKNTFSHLVRNMMTREDESDEAKRFRRYRWGWIALAVAGTVGYIAMQGLTIVIPVVIQRDGAETSEKLEEAETNNEEELEEEPEEELLNEVEIDELDV